MEIIKMFKKGLEQLQRKKRVRKLKSELISKRETLSNLYLKIGSSISNISIKEFEDFEEVNSMHNVLAIIEKLEQENLELEEKIDITKVDYNEQIENYTPLIAELKENLSIPQNKLVALKEKLSNLKIKLKSCKDSLKDKEGIFKDTQERLDSKSEEDDLDEEKLTALGNDYKRLQKELLEITHNFETKTDEYNLLKNNIKIVEEEIKTADEQINTYKKEIGKLKKEKIREIDAIKKIISSNKNSVISRNKELESIYRNIGNISFSKRILPKEFEEIYKEIDLVNSDIKKINEDRQTLNVEIDKTDKMVLLKFFSIILIIIAIIILIFIGIYRISNSNSAPINKTNSIVKINNIACNKGEIIMKIPKSLKPEFTVKSSELLSKIIKEDDNLKVVFSADLEDKKDTYFLHIFSSNGEFTKYKIKTKVDKKNCLKFYLPKN